MGDSLRVLVVGLNYAPEPTGIAPYTAGMARGLAAAGHKVKVLAAHPHYPRWAYDGTPETHSPKDAGLALARLRPRLPSSPEGLRRAVFEADFGLRASVRPSGRPDVVVAVSPALISSAMVRARHATARRRAAFGVVVQDLYSLGVTETGTGGGAAAKALTRLESAVLRGADGVVAIHDRFARRMVESLGVRADRLSVIRNWTHIKPVAQFDRAAFRQSMGWRDDETVVLHAGAMGHKQGLENVVEAARIAQEGSLPLRFVLMGDGGRRGELERLGQELRTLSFVDPVPDADFMRALGSADVLLLNERPSLAEMAVPSKLTSYFAAGRPVLAATSAGSISAHEVSAAGAGVRVDPQAPGLLVIESLRLGGDSAESARLAANGAAYVAEVLSEQTAIEKYDAWVRELASRRGHGRRERKA